MLVGSQSFWEGIDVPGDALQCVLIDKLPFPPPNDPLVEARVKRLEAQGRNPFDDYFVAEAAVSLKQGAGRLIRSETDRGLLVVCDPRMARHGLRPPPARGAAADDACCASEAEALAWLADLAPACSLTCWPAARAHQSFHHALVLARDAVASGTRLFGKVLASARGRRRRAAAVRPSLS